MRGIISSAGYVPFRRLARREISDFFGSGGGSGSRSVASFDEDTTTLGFEAARAALRSTGGAGPVVDGVWFSTTSPAYLDKTNAAAIHCALRLSGDTAAADMGGSLRSGVAAVMAALDSSGKNIVVALADIRGGLPTSADEAGGGDGAAAFVVGDGSGANPVIAEYLGSASTTEEFVDRWRVPGDSRSKVWEEKFGEGRYLQAGPRAFGNALKSCGIDAASISKLCVSGMHSRAVKSVVKALTSKFEVSAEAVTDDFAKTVGQCGTAHPGLVLAGALESAGPGEVIALVHLCDGADVLFFRTTDAISTWSPQKSVASQIESGGALSYAKFLSWRSSVEIEPPRRPEPSRVSSTAAWRANDWKYGFTGSEDRTTHAVHLPPSRVSMKGGAVDDMVATSRSDTAGTIVTFTIDRVAYSPSPPIVFAVVDFDGGGRFPLEITDVEADKVAIGDRVEMTFRRLASADGIHNYFWKARPLRG